MDRIKKGVVTSEFLAGPALSGIVAGYGLSLQPETVAEAVAIAAAILGMSFVQGCYAIARGRAKGGVQ